jgi:hypothetical protein
LLFIFGIVAPRSLRAFEADSRRPDKEPVVALLPAARLQMPREIFFEGGAYPPPVVFY